MIESIYKSIRTLLKDDGELQAILGGQYVYVAHVSQTNQIPSVTILEQPGTSKKRTCYDTFSIREDHPTVQIDCWSKRSRLETVKMADRIDKLLIADGVADTWGWHRISSGKGMFEPDTGIYHLPLRYRFAYKILDCARFDYAKFDMSVFC